MHLATLISRGGQPNVGLNGHQAVARHWPGGILHRLRNKPPFSDSSVATSIAAAFAAGLLPHGD